ncbi:hypothetical protein HZH68_017152 [Vespula germanica]|uniref:Uncharacterized protein n=1 Tax=Vespula germanica TaxID=30212 RepID=A0A834MMU2_VESGE|nr:hypothetical protein HZH68_017152 [Vespula germanica]
MRINPIPQDLRRKTARLAVAKGTSATRVDASYKRKNGHFGPNLSVIIGAFNPTKIVGVARGLKKLGSSKMTNPPYTGFIYYIEILEIAASEDKTARLAATKGTSIHLLVSMLLRKVRQMILEEAEEQLLQMLQLLEDMVL